MTVHAVHHINCATMCPRAPAFLLGGAKKWVAHCLIVETARDGLVVVDTGFGTRDVDGSSRIARPFRAMARPALDLNETAIEQVRARGYKPEDVRHIVVTHLDLDHAGGLCDFPHATVHLHAKEHIAATTRPSFREKERYMATHWAHGPKWQLASEDGDTWRGLPAVTKLRGLDADIGILPMHGHTRGHSAVIVGAGKRWLVHAGDAYFHHHSVDGAGKVPLVQRTFEKLTQIDAAARRASLAALRQLRTSYEDVELFCAHDPDEFAAISARSGADGSTASQQASG